MPSLQSAPASGCALAAALASVLCVVDTMLRGQLWVQGRAGSAEEAWRGSSVDWEVVVGRGAQA